jgi:glucose-6-phosphate 1-dehydrogenase
VRLVFKNPPQLGFGLRGSESGPNQIVVKLDPSTGIRFRVDARKAASQQAALVDLDMEFDQQGGEGATPYEVLLHAAMTGQSARFGRQDTIEEAWRVMQPLVDAPSLVLPYKPGSWGPAEADKLLAGHGAWHDPWLPS